MYNFNYHADYEFDPTWIKTIKPGYQVVIENGIIQTGDANLQAKLKKYNLENSLPSDLNGLFLISIKSRIYFTDVYSYNSEVQISIPYEQRLALLKSLKLNVPTFRNMEYYRSKNECGNIINLYKSKDLISLYSVGIITFNAINAQYDLLTNDIHNPNISLLGNRNNKKITISDFKDECYYNIDVSDTNYTIRQYENPQLATCQKKVKTNAKIHFYVTDILHTLHLTDCDFSPLPEISLDTNTMMSKKKLRQFLNLEKFKIEDFIVFMKMKNITWEQLYNLYSNYSQSEILNILQAYENISFDEMKHKKNPISPSIHEFLKNSDIIINAEKPKKLKALLTYINNTSIDENNVHYMLNVFTKLSEMKVETIPVENKTLCANIYYNLLKKLLLFEHEKSEDLEMTFLSQLQTFNVDEKIRDFVKMLILECNNKLCRKIVHILEQVKDSTDGSINECKHDIIFTIRQKVTKKRKVDY